MPSSTHQSSRRKTQRSRSPSPSVDRNLVRLPSSSKGSRAVKRRSREIDPQARYSTHDVRLRASSGSPISSPLSTSTAPASNSITGSCTVTPLSAPDSAVASSTKFDEPVPVSPSSFAAQRLDHLEQQAFVEDVPEPHGHSTSSEAFERSDAASLASTATPMQQPPPALSSEAPAKPSSHLNNQEVEALVWPNRGKQFEARSTEQFDTSSKHTEQQDGSNDHPQMVMVPTNTGPMAAPWPPTPSSQSLPTPFQMRFPQQPYFTPWPYSYGQQPATPEAMAPPSPSVSIVHHHGVRAQGNRSREKRAERAGYHRLSTMLAEGSVDKTGKGPHKIYRRFEALQHRTLLRLQDELSSLESQLERCDQRIAEMEIWQHGRPQAASMRNEAAWAAQGHEPWHRREELLTQIEVKLEQYSASLSRYANMKEKFGKAGRAGTDSYRRWLAESELVCGAESLFLSATADLMDLDAQGPARPAAAVALGGEQASMGGPGSREMLLGVPAALLLLLVLLATSSGPQKVVLVLAAMAVGGAALGRETMRRTLPRRDAMICLGLYGAVLAVAAVGSGCGSAQGDSGQ